MDAEKTNLLQTSAPIASLRLLQAVGLVAPLPLCAFALSFDGMDAVETAAE